MRIILSLLCVLFMLPASAQKGHTMDSSYLASGVAYRFRIEKGIQFQKSTDNGKTWAAIEPQWKHNEKMYGHPFIALTDTDVHFINDSTGFTLGGLDCYQWRNYMLRTGDGGRTWEKVFSPGEAGIIAYRNGALSKKMMHFSDRENGLLLLASNKGELVIARTKDAGRKWKTETISITGDHYPVKLLFTDALNGEIILEAMDKPQKKLITRDGGLTWSPAQ